MLRRLERVPPRYGTDLLGLIFSFNLEYRGLEEYLDTGGIEIGGNEFFLVVDDEELD